MTDSKTATERLRELMDEVGVHWVDSSTVGRYGNHIAKTEWIVFDRSARFTEWGNGTVRFECGGDFTPEQAIAATLGEEKAGKKSPPEGGPGPCGQPSDAIIHDAVAPGNKKAKAHPYGYEPDTGAFDVTRCECGCLNDISATYCNDCGGEIEIDEHAEKEIYHTPRHLVFAEKHDDGSLEFGGKRYIVATLGSDEYQRGYDDGLHANTKSAFAAARRIVQDAVGECEVEDPDGMRMCSHCHYYIGEHYRYCAHCGKKVKR